MDVGTGIITNNRRLVTKTMWFNGTALSAQARRALENERVTVVAHESGFIHTLFPRATMDPDAYSRFSGRLRKFLQTPLTPELLGNFIRHNAELQKCFQARWFNFGQHKYIAMEKLLAYEYKAPFRFNDDTRERLMMEVAGEDFESHPLPDRIILEDLEKLVRERKVDLRTDEGFALMVHEVGQECPRAQHAIEQLRRFIWTEPRLPDADSKTFQREQPPLGIEHGMGRDDIIARLESLRATNELAGLAFYAYRDLNRTEPEPFVKAAMHRCPVAPTATADLNDDEVAAAVEALDAESIYDEPGRLAQPDEVWNYQRGDGAEKALLLADILRARHPGWKLDVEVAPDAAVLKVSGQGVAERSYTFASAKDLRPQEWDCNV